MYNAGERLASRQMSALRHPRLHCDSERVVSVLPSIVEWTTIQSPLSALRAHVLMCWVVSILPTTYWVDDTVRCGCLLAR